MKAHTQKIASVIIGLIIAVLIVYIGFRIVEKQQGRASAPKNLECTINGSSGVVRYVDSTSDTGIASYATSASYDSNQQTPFLAEAKNSPEKVADGYLQTIEIGPLVDTDYVVKVGDVVEKCKRSGGEKEQVPTDTPNENPTQNTVDAGGDTAIVEPTSGVSNASLSNGLPLNQVEQFFEENTDAYLKECVENFKVQKDASGNSYTNLASVCYTAWLKVNPPTPTVAPSE